MDTVDYICCNINGTLKTECLVCSPKVVVDCLRKRNHIESLFTKKICGFLSSVAAEYNKTVKAKLFVVLLHSLNLVNAVLVNNTHKLERLS